MKFCSFDIAKEEEEEDKGQYIVDEQSVCKRELTPGHGFPITYQYTYEREYLFLLIILLTARTKRLKTLGLVRSRTLSYWILLSYLH